MKFKITDFGIGAVASGLAIAGVRHESTSVPERRRQTVLGAYSPLYASPQQMNGGLADPRDDVHALSTKSGSAGRSNQAAQMIGWPPGSPFQFEVGFHDGAWGLLGFLCLWVGGSFWLATGLGWSFFMLGAAAGHVYQTVREGNYAPYNFLTIFSDGFIAVWLLTLLYLYHRWVGFLDHDQARQRELQTQ